MAPKAANGTSGHLQTDEKRLVVPPEDEAKLRPEKRLPLLMNADVWLQLKNDYDGIDKNLWRIGDNLYDFSKFADRHPGGRTWIEVTRGTDITEAFEVVHFFGNENKDELLKKYFVRSCAELPRKFHFTFHQDGFYMRVKRRAQKILRPVGIGPTRPMLMLQDGLAAGAIVLMVASILTHSWLLAMLAGLALGMNMSCAHNFFHQADNFRRFYWDMTLFSSYEWRVTHMISHHLFTNTYTDFEMHNLYPFIDLFSFVDKLWIHRLITPFTWILVMVVAAVHQLVTRIVAVVCGITIPKWEYLIPFAELVLFCTLSDLSWTKAVWMWLLMQTFAVIWLSLTSITTTHHHPSSYHGGDVPYQDSDWGLHQLDSGRDIKTDSLFLVATTFKNHMLHHLFPTVDHSKLHLLYPALEETCREFGVDYEFHSMWDMVSGFHTQIARNQSLNYQQRTELRNKKKNA